MRNAFFNSLYQVAKSDDRLITLSSDTGALVLDQFREGLPSRCINVGIAEANMIGVAAGLAMSGKIVYVYAIIPFVTMRCYEQIRVSVCCQDLPVKMVGVGAGVDYSTLGPTHHGLEDIAIMRLLPGMTILSPCDDISAAALAKVSYQIPGPVYVRLDRSGQPQVYTDSQADFIQGLNLLRKGKDVCIVSTGRIVNTALQVAQQLAKASIEASVIDLYRVKPLNAEMLMSVIKQARCVATIEEHSIVGGIGSAISEILAEQGQSYRLTRFGLPDSFCRQYGSRDYLHKLNKLDSDYIATAIQQSLLSKVR
jgi:transketolase